MYKGSISFGLVYIPITLHAVIKNNDIGFNMLDKKTKSRVKYIKTCELCENRELLQGDIVKGYQYEKNKYVVFDESDFEKIKTKKDKSIIIEEFISLDEIDPVYYNKAYYVNPAGAERAYQLLLKAMEKENKIGIAKTVIGTKETLVALRVKNGEMLLNTMFFEEEVQKSPVKTINEEIKDGELKLAVSIINSMKTKFNIKHYKDEYRARVAKAIESKVNGKEIVSAPREKAAHITNLMEALQKSLQNIEKKPKKISGEKPVIKAKAKKA